MTENRVAAPIQVRVEIVGTGWVQAAATSSTGAHPSTTTRYILVPPIVMPSPRLQFGDPIVAGEVR